MIRSVPKGARRNPRRIWIDRQRENDWHLLHRHRPNAGIAFRKSKSRRLWLSGGDLWYFLSWVKTKNYLTYLLMVFCVWNCVWEVPDFGLSGRRRVPPTLGLHCVTVTLLRAISLPPWVIVGCIHSILWRQRYCAADSLFRKVLWSPSRGKCEFLGAARRGRSGSGAFPCTDRTH